MQCFRRHNCISDLDIAYFTGAHKSPSVYYTIAGVVPNFRNVSSWSQLPFYVLLPISVGHLNSKMPRRGHQHQRHDAIGPQRGEQVQLAVFKGSRFSPFLAGLQELPRGSYVQRWY
jgi:hypothetical protein